MEYKNVEILLVEDNPNDVELELRAFKKHNIINKIFVVRDGAEALDYLFGMGLHANRKDYFPPKMVLLDLKLPKISGLEVLQSIRANEQTRLLPVVILTSSKEEKDLIEGYKLGVNSYIVKPVAFEDLLKVTAELGLYWLLLNKVPADITQKNE